MQSEPPEQGPSALLEDDDALSQSTKRRRTSERSSNPVSERSESRHAPSTARRTLTRSSPQRGSSREMTPPEGSQTIKYTRTGRVSKANKGLRVHHCDECGKTYTRAEHLRRHQQNHKPGGFPCDVPGCGRSFYREDLLIRHKARQHDPLNPASPNPSGDSHDSPPVHPARQPGGGSRIAPPAAPVTDIETEGPDTPTATQIGVEQARNLRTDKGYLDLHSLSGAAPNLGILADGDYPALYHNNGGWGRWDTPRWGSSSPYSPTGNYSPPNGLSGPPYYHQPQPNRARQVSDTSHLGYYFPSHASRSPISAGSSTVHLPHWGHSAHDHSFPYPSTCSSSDGSFANGGVAFNHMADPQLLSPDYRDFMEQHELVVPTGTPPLSIEQSVDEQTFSSEDRYLEAYWRWIHPFFPVIHRPTFQLRNASPLLRAAVLALGAQALDNASDKKNARITHERCMKVLKKRTINQSHSHRVCDIQAIFLVEVYSIFKSRRPPLQFSKTFENAYQHLADDPETFNTQLEADSVMYGLSGEPAFISDHGFALESKCKQRLFEACYILDQQHVSLFGRQRSACFNGSGLELLWPQSQASWDAVNGSEQDDPSCENVWQAVSALSLEERDLTSFDTFQTMLIMATIFDTNGKLAAPSCANTPARLTDMGHLRHLKLAYHTFMLCKHSPIRELLAVAGESWVMGEKISIQAEFTAAQIRGWQWAKGLAITGLGFPLQNDEKYVDVALRHALQILQLHQARPRTGLLFQEWSIYLASIVIWATSYVCSEDTRKAPRVAVPNPSEPQVALEQLDRTVSELIAAGPDAKIEIDKANDVLLWTKAKIEKVDGPLHSGITSDTLNVLNRLVTRGSQDDWFGS